MTTVYCVAFDPDTERGSVGGVEWRRKRDNAEALYTSLCNDPAHAGDTLTYFELQVREGTDPGEITLLASDTAWHADYRALMRRDPMPAAAG